jgi:signal transduction histidine kinase/tetratricopeptide (TPR) repeat protein
MRKVVILYGLLLFSVNVFAQNKTIDSLKLALSVAKEDTNKVSLFVYLGNFYQWSYPDSAILYCQQGLQLAKKLNFTTGEIDISGILAEALAVKGNFSKALDIRLKVMQLAEKSGDPYRIYWSQLGVGNVYFYSGDQQNALNYYYKGKANKEVRPEDIETISGFIGEAFFALHQLDSALLYIQKAYDLDIKEKSHWSIPYYYMAAIYSQKGQYKESLDYYREGIRVSVLNKDIVDGYNGIAAAFKKNGQVDSSVYYAEKAIAGGQHASLIPEVIETSSLLTDIYSAKHIQDSAFKYQGIMLAMKDSLFSREKVKQMENLSFNEQMRQQEIQQEREQFKSKLKIYVLIAAILIFLLMTFFLFRSNRYRQKAYVLLQQQARKAVREASLDRVRAEIASMRSKEDLQRITPLMWRELTNLKVPFVRCGVFIVDEVLNKIQLYLSAPDGHPLGVLNLSIDDNELTLNSVEYWRKGAVYTTHWDKEKFLNWIQTMVDKGQIHDRKTYQGEATPPESLNLYIVPFTQGMLYIANTSRLTEDEIQLVKSLAESFAIAYARYEDFKQLEDAKSRVEATLSELKSAQTQLIQSEKMASLGELTAGIAHEIQNPLNFVNNFSEVNKELIDELQQELQAGKIDDAIAISNDIKDNEEKINHHGRRADAIVKGMLQHSRSTSAIKEATDINALADEYLRLAYHGLRAKDNSFNATMKTDYDKTIGKINIISQDIGRAILNLLTNAFYAVSEKKKSARSDYEPMVSVSTKKLNDKIEIRVTDNGNGIPQKVLDKIFQPFFTTKPTGQGTGLGLSLSYDIVKAHSGEIKVETKEGGGTEFIIFLPTDK